MTSVFPPEKVDLRSAEMTCDPTYTVRPVSMSCQLRLATLEDIPRIVEMGIRFLTETPYRFGRVNPTQMAALTRTLIDGGAGNGSVVFVAEREGELVGMIGMFLVDNPITGDATASELFWWVEPEHRGPGLRLLTLAAEWAKGAGAAVLQMLAPNDAIAQLYERLGFERMEIVYARAL